MEFSLNNSKTFIIFTIIFWPIFGISGPSSSGVYELDASHTKIGFEISHLVIATVDGQFNKFTGSFEYDEQAQSIKDAKINIDVASINTNEPDRDKHLRSADFFDAAQYPKITFSKAKLTSTGGKPSKLAGTLTMHGMSREVNLDVDFKGFATDPWGNKKMVFNLKGAILRKDFGLTWNKSLDGGGLMIGDEVTLNIKAEANLKK